MSLPRVLLSASQAACASLAWLPPNKTQKEHRYALDQSTGLQIAPLIFVFQLYNVYAWVALEILAYSKSQFFEVPEDTSRPVIATPLFLIGSMAVFLGTWIRLDCFRTLGQLFTFDLTVQPSHRLIKHRFYAYVRHPSYTGSMLMIFGVAVSFFTAHSAFVELVAACFPEFGIAILRCLWAIWWAWTVSVGVSRAIAEDAQMKALFKGEWEAYARAVPWWFFPGIC